MFYMPQYHNLPDGRQVFLRFPDPERHGEAVSRLLPTVPAGAEGAAFLAQTNGDPRRLVLIAEIAGTVAGCGLLELEDQPQMQVAVWEPCRDLALETLMKEALSAVAAQKGIAL